MWLWSVGLLGIWMPLWTTFSTSSKPKLSDRVVLYRVCWAVILFSCPNISALVQRSRLFFLSVCLFYSIGWITNYYEFHIMVPSRTKALKLLQLYSHTFTNPVDHWSIVHMQSAYFWRSCATYCMFFFTQ